MATLHTAINLFPALLLALKVVGEVAIALVAGLLLAGIAAWVRATFRNQAVRLEAASRGLSEASAAFLCQALGSDGAETARALLRAPELLRQRLGAELGRFSHVERAARFATSCAQLLDELRQRTPSFDGAPAPFSELLVRDRAEPDRPPLRAFVLAADSSQLTIVSPEICPWPVRRDLLVLGEGGPFPVTLVLRPVPGGRAWVLGHELAGVFSERRSTTRFPCRVAAWTLPATAGTYALRARLQGGEPLDPETLRRLEAWPQRHAATIEDLSADGARLSVDHPFPCGERFYLVLSDPEGLVTALPLTEVVSVREEEGRVVLGTRFCAVRLKERVLLSDFAQSAAVTAPA